MMMLLPMGVPGVCPKHVRAWTQEEDEILLRMHGKKNAVEIAGMLHKRTPGAVRARFACLRDRYPGKIKPLNYRFTPKDDRFIRRHCLTMSAAELGAHIGVGVNAVRQYASRNGIRLSKCGDYHPQTKYPDSDVELIRQLRDEYNLKFREIGEKFEMSAKSCAWIYAYRQTATDAIIRELLP
ncbi:AsnC family protein [Salmonella enterica subsp. enterica serovar Freetown]|nr:AsnC family protein [Salmonella enterica]EEF0620024.1 AsnC family protein [Salmonella enterica subsp. enterica serovar Freetown]